MNRDRPFSFPGGRMSSLGSMGQATFSPEVDPGVARYQKPDSWVGRARDEEVAADD